MCKKLAAALKGEAQGDGEIAVPVLERIAVIILLVVANT